MLADNYDLPFVLAARVRIRRGWLSTAAAVSDRSGGMEFLSLLWLKML
jgi:hypothetical protein